jgi:hypothetical protein
LAATHTPPVGHFAASPKSIVATTLKIDQAHFAIRHLQGSPRLRQYRFRNQVAIREYWPDWLSDKQYNCAQGLSTASIGSAESYLITPFMI